MPRPRRTAVPDDARASALARQVRDRRLTLNLTQAELADLAGLSRTTVHHIESGAANVRFDAVLAVADVLGCDLRLTPRYAS